MCEPDLSDYLQGINANWQEESAHKNTAALAYSDS